MIHSIRDKLLKIRLLTLGLLVAFVLLGACKETALLQDNTVSPVNFEMKGVSFVAQRNPIDSSEIRALKQINCNFISQMPFAFGQIGSPELIYNEQYQWWGETSEGILQTTIMAKQQGIKTMLKPQIWFRNSYTGAFTLKAEEDWARWEKSYSDYILNFAHLADSLQIETFCIGTELGLTVKERPAFWGNLIDSIRSFYDGKLTYAANWDDYQQVPFWEKLDYIGIDAYFPLSGNDTPSVATLTEAWQPVLKSIYDFQLLKNKEVLFTEIGYKSVDKCAFEPWNPTSTTVNLAAQSNATQAFLEVFGNKAWFTGVFIWKWYPKHENAGGVSNSDYTPQNKPAQDIIKQAFGVAE